MPQQRLGNDEFLTQLATLLTSTHSSQHGSVFLTQKPLTTSSATKDLDISTPPSQILIRATNGATQPSKAASKVPASKITKRSKPKDRVKLATVVEASELEAFYVKYAEVCKKGMEGLRKRDKKKAKAKKKSKKNA